MIARLTKELTGAREALSTLKPHGSYAAGDTDVDMEKSVEEQGMSEAVAKKLDDKVTAFFKPLISPFSLLRP